VSSNLKINIYFSTCYLIDYISINDFELTCCDIYSGNGLIIPPVFLQVKLVMKGKRKFIFGYENKKTGFIIIIKTERKIRWTPIEL